MIINIGDFIVNEITYPNRCLSASFGGQGIECIKIPWENTDNNPWDYKYENGNFILDKIELSTDPFQRIAELKKMLADTDYCVIKVAEGVATREYYAEIFEQRSQWRAELNSLEY